MSNEIFLSTVYVCDKTLYGYISGTLFGILRGIITTCKRLKLIPKLRKNSNVLLQVSLKTVLIDTCSSNAKGSQLLAHPETPWRADYSDPPDSCVWLMPSPFGQKCTVQIFEFGR